MTGNGALAVGVEPATVKTPVRRVAHHQVKTFRAEVAPRLSEIILQDRDLLFQTIRQNVLPGRCRQFRLDLETHDLPCLTAMRQNQRNHPAAGPQINHTIMAVNFRKTRQQDRIQREAIPPLRLVDDQLSFKERTARQHRPPILKKTTIRDWPGGK